MRPPLPAWTLLVCAIGTPLAATDFYVDPVHGSDGGDGSAGNPWRTLEEVWESDLIESRHWATLPYEAGAELEVINEGAPVQPGDRLILRSGFHGQLWLRGAYNELPITVLAEDGHTPQVSRVFLSAAANWQIRGLSISPSHAPMYSSATMVEVENHGYHGPSWSVVIEDCDIFSVDDASAWTADDWISVAASGVHVEGENVSVLRNTLRNVRHGITASGDHAAIRRNTIDGFSGDGMRGFGDFALFEYNTVKNALAGSGHGDGNHDDGFQSFTVGPGGVGTGEIHGVVLRGNLFLNHEDPEHPLFSTLQGIGCFDGFYVDWTVENNVVITDHWHGISLYGLRDSRVVNNTVIDIKPGDPGPPWIRVTEHKDDTPSENVLVRNNLSQSYSLSGIDITEDHNLEVTDPALYFVDPRLDVRLLPTSPALDAGSALGAPPLDAERIPRPQGAGVDIGAYERHMAGTEPALDRDDPCTGVWDLILSQPDAGTPALHQSCNWILAGNGYVVGNLQQVTLAARREVGLRDGFRVEDGGELRVEVGATVLNP